VFVDVSFISYWGKSFLFNQFLIQNKKSYFSKLYIVLRMFECLYFFLSLRISTYKNIEIYSLPEEMLPTTWRALSRIVPCWILREWSDFIFISKLLNVLNVNSCLFLNCDLDIGDSLPVQNSVISLTLLSSLYPLPFGTLKSITELFIFQGKKLNRRKFTALEAEHRNFYYVPNLM